MSKLSSLLNTYESMVASKESDRIESNLVNSGQANFLASSRGHEGSALLNTFLKENDWLCCHYRDKALMLARGITNEQFFYSALCKKNHILLVDKWSRT
jgi:2-oxoisovalerate dehydrogenase E1 component